MGIPDLNNLIVPLLTGLSKGLLSAAPSIIVHVGSVFGLLWGVRWLKGLLEEVIFENHKHKMDADYYDPRNAAKRRDEGVFVLSEDRDDHDEDEEYLGHD